MSVINGSLSSDLRWSVDLIMSLCVRITAAIESLLCCHLNGCCDCLVTFSIGRFFWDTVGFGIKISSVSTCQSIISFFFLSPKNVKISRWLQTNILKSFGCDRVSVTKETCKYFSYAKRKRVEKAHRWEWGGKIYLNILGSSKGILAQTQTLETGWRRPGFVE